MRDSLKSRLNDGAQRRILPEEYPRVCQDALTDLLRQQQEIDIVQGFVAFTKGFLLDTSVHPDILSPVRERLKRMENDLRRMGGGGGCC